MRTDAEVDERVAILDRVARDIRLPGGFLFDQLHLERLALRGKEPQRLVARPHLALVDEILRRQLLHLLLDGLEVLGHERPIDDEIVEEAFVDGRTDAALGSRKEVGHGRRHEVRRAVAEERERFGTLVGDEPQPHVLVQRVREIDQLAIDDRRDGRFRQAWRDQCRNVTRCGANGHGTAGAVR